MTQIKYTRITTVLRHCFRGLVKKKAATYFKVPKSTNCTDYRAKRKSLQFFWSHACSVFKGATLYFSYSIISV